MSKRQKIREFIGSYTFSKVRDSSQNLENSGFLFKKEFFSKDEIKLLFPNLEFSSGNLEKKIYLKNLFDKYSKISKNQKVFVRARNKSNKIDYGLIDIRDPSELDDNESLNLKIDILLKRVEKYIPKKYVFSHFNVYLYSDCFKPRCLHIDSLNAKHLKAFIYLTTSNYEDGVYAYIPGSHKNKLINMLQYFLNNIFGSDLGVSLNDGTLYSLKNCRKFSANIGDMLISDQRGIHGDLPCTLNGSGKIVLVANFLNEKFKK